MASNGTSNSGKYYNNEKESSRYTGKSIKGQYKNERGNEEFNGEKSKRILNNIPKQNRNYVQKQLNMLDDNFMDYLGYWNEKYYRNGFCDGVQLICGFLKK